MQTLIIGPLFTATSTPFNGDDWIVPLGVRLEWAHQHEAAAISLFRHHSRHAPNAVMFWNMVFALPQLPFDVECFAHQVVETPHGIYLPFEALLSELYARYRVGPIHIHCFGGVGGVGAIGWFRSVSNRNAGTIDSPSGRKEICP